MKEKPTIFDIIVMSIITLIVVIIIINALVNVHLKTH